MTYRSRCKEPRILVSFLIFLALSACSGTPPDRITEKEGFLYGYGTAATREEAEERALLDLVTRATAASVLKRRNLAIKPLVDPAVAAGLALETRIAAQAKTDSGQELALRMALADWEASLAIRETALRNEGLAILTDLGTSPIEAGKLEDAAALCDRLVREGLGDLVTIEEKAAILLKDALEAASLVALATISMTIENEDRLLSSQDTVAVRLTDAKGAAVSGIPLRWSWSRAGGGEADSYTAAAVSDSAGTVRFNAPADGDTAAVRYVLDVATDYASRSNGSIVKLDGRLSVREQFLVSDDILSVFGPFVPVAAGSFYMGASPTARNSSKREESRTATTEAYAIAVFPVSNYQYELYLHANPQALPGEYADNPTYNSAEQPLTGITVGQAEAFCDWLSAASGKRVRLPGEAEWEKAAKAGGNTVYPWGDQSPREGPLANFLGNGRFRAPSPRGSFPGGMNAWGLEDMAGNVWEFVRLAASGGDTVLYGVKGGSWMEGPGDLRISNRRDIGPDTNGADIGLRILVEVDAE